MSESRHPPGQKKAKLETTCSPYSSIPDWTGEIQNAVFWVPVGRKGRRLSGGKHREPLADGVTRVYVAASIEYEGVRQHCLTPKVAITLIAIDTYRAEHTYDLAGVAAEINLAAWDKAATDMGTDLNASAKWLIEQIWLVSASQSGTLGPALYDALFNTSKESLVGIKGEFVPRASGGYNITQWRGRGFFYDTDDTIRDEVRARLKSQPGADAPFKVSMIGRGALYHWVLMHMAGLHKAPSKSFRLVDGWSGYLTNNLSDHEALLAELDKLPTPEEGMFFPKGFLQQILEDIHKNKKGHTAMMMYGEDNYINSGDVMAAHKDITMPKVGRRKVDDIIKTTLRPLRLRLYLRKLQDDIGRRGIKTEVKAQRDRAFFSNGIYDGYQQSVDGYFETVPEFVQARFSHLLV